MSRLLLLFTLILVVFGAIYRERIYLRDPLGHVERGGVRVKDSRVFINYSNDALVQEGSQFLLVQAWNQAPGVPVSLHCVQGMACLTEQAHAASLPLQTGGHPATGVTMTDREVRFLEASGLAVRITLR